MFKFIKGNKVQNNQTSEEQDPEEIINTTDEGSQTFETALSIPKHWNITDEERYVFAFHNAQSPALKKNQLAIYGTELLRQTEDSVKVTALIRSTVTEPIRFEEAVIILSGENNQALARKTFPLNDLETLPANSARPWEFTFEKNDFLIDINEPINTWSLGFELKPKHKLDLEESWATSMEPETETALQNIVAEAPELKPGEMNFMGIQAKMKEDDSLAVTVLIRNGAEKNIHLEKIPLAVKDANGEEIARGSFTMNDFQVKSNTSKPWTFIFPKNKVVNPTPDLSKWHAYVIQ